MASQEDINRLESIKTQVSDIVNMFSGLWSRIAGNSVGKKEGVTGIHNSFPERYSKFSVLFSSGHRIDEFPEDLKVIIDGIGSSQVIKIRETSVGTGEAILGLIKQLNELNIRTEVIINGLVDPKESIDPTILDILKTFTSSQQITFAVRDLTQYHENELLCDVCIRSNVHQYLTKDQLTLAISNALETNKIVALQPYPTYPYSAMLIYRDNQENVRTFIMPVIE